MKIAITYKDFKTGSTVTSLYKSAIAKKAGVTVETVKRWMKLAEKEGGILTTKNFELTLSEFIQHGSSV